VSDPKDINPFSETDPEAPKEIPPLTVMSLSVRAIVNHKENKREVVCATARIWHNSEPVCFETVCSSAESSFSSTN
jgi:DNA polymerase alpha subunit A